MRHGGTLVLTVDGGSADFLVDGMQLGELPRSLAEALDAGLAPAFGEDVAVVLGDANHSVLKMLSNTLNEVPRVSLRESKVEGDDPITQPSSPEMPAPNSSTSWKKSSPMAKIGKLVKKILFFFKN